MAFAAEGAVGFAGALASDAGGSGGVAFCSTE